jgi:hypothetical protein
MKLSSNMTEDEKLTGVQEIVRKAYILVETNNVEILSDQNLIFVAAAIISKQRHITGLALELNPSAKDKLNSFIGGVIAWQETAKLLEGQVQDMARFIALNEMIERKKNATS